MHHLLFPKHHCTTNSPPPSSNHTATDNTQSNPRSREKNQHTSRNPQQTQIQNSLTTYGRFSVRKTIFSVETTKFDVSFSR